ncbi:MAG: cysteine synthase A [Clostridia bacterium]|nr:cysteine synthase A [Clostridia bacterium]
MKIYDSLTQLIGNTPLIKLSSLSLNGSDVIAKAECFNPYSVKDRVAYKMLTSALNCGIIDKNTVIIEPTSGNTGIGLAFCCASMGMKCILTMPSSMSEERKKLLSALGAELVLTDPKSGMQGAIDMANELKAKLPSAFIPQQFENESNPLAHESTANEILTDTDGKIDYFVSCIGTGGTISGVGKILKERLPSVKIVGIEPYDSPLITKGVAGPHKIQGIGANFIPKTFDKSVVDEIVTIKTEDAYATSREVAKKEGFLVGISSGSALFIASEIAKRESGKRIVALCPDSGERYLSTELFGE